LHNRVVSPGGFDYVGIDPRDYDWRKTEESVEIADAYVAEELFADKDFTKTDS
jgi:hypothetical protein